MATAIIITPAFEELVEYLAKSATPEQILAFKVSDAMQDHVDKLLDKNNEGELTAAERQVLDEFVEFDQHMMILKARAAAALKVVSW